MLFVARMYLQAVHLGRGARAVDGGLGDPVVAGVLDVVDHVLELDGHVEIERRLDAARHDLSPGRLGRAADLHRELEGLAILGPADADRGQTGLIDLGTGPAVADQVDDRSRSSSEVVAVVPETPRRTVTFRLEVGSPLTWTYSLVPLLSTSWRTSWFIRNVESPRTRPVVVLAEIAVASVVDRARYWWEYIRKSTRSTGTYGSRVTSGLRLANQLRTATVISFRASMPACWVPRNP